MFLGIRDTSDYSVTGGGKEGVRNDNGGICNAEMEKKVFLILSSRNSDFLVNQNAPCEFLRLNFKIKLFF